MSFFSSGQQTSGRHCLTSHLAHAVWVFVSAWYLLTEGTDEDLAEADRKISELHKFTSQSWRPHPPFLLLSC